RQPEELRLAVELAPEHAGPSAGGTRRRIDSSSLHRREVDHEPAVTERVAADAVATGAHANQEITLACEVDRGDDVGDACAAGDAGWAAVDRAVPDRAGLVVAFVFGADHRAGDGGACNAGCGGGRHRCRFGSHATTVRRCIATD